MGAARWSVKSYYNSEPRVFLWILFGLAAIGMTARNILMPSSDMYTHYNNYIIFKQSFFHLLDGLNLYVHYPSEQYDLYKYSPFFALFFGIFAWMPDWLGLGLWNLLNVLVLVYAVGKLPVLSKKQQLLFGILLLQETITATINSQSNALIAGLLILAWVSLEKSNWWRAALFISLTVFIKLFGIVFFALFLFYPKWWKGIIPVLSIMGALFFIPFLFDGFKTLQLQCNGYIDLLANDHGNFVKYSVMGWLQAWFSMSPPKNLLVLSGLIIQLVVTGLSLCWKHTITHRAILAASWLIWMVIFNHMAESATFVIAVAGVLLWFFYSPQPRWLKMAILIPVMLFTCFGPSDIYPPKLRELIVVDWQLKVFPCILAWVICIVELIKYSISSLTKSQPAPL